MESFTNLHIILVQGPCWSLYHSNFSVCAARVSTCCVFFRQASLNTSQHILDMLQVSGVLRLQRFATLLLLNFRINMYVQEATAWCWVSLSHSLIFWDDLPQPGTTWDTSSSSYAGAIDVRSLPCLFLVLMWVLGTRPRALIQQSLYHCSHLLQL